MRGRGCWGIGGGHRVGKSSWKKIERNGGERERNESNDNDMRKISESTEERENVRNEN